MNIRTLQTNIYTDKYYIWTVPALDVLLDQKNKALSKTTDLEAKLNPKNKNVELLVSFENNRKKVY